MKIFTPRASDPRPTLFLNVQTVWVLTYTCCKNEEMQQILIINKLRRSESPRKVDSDLCLLQEAHSARCQMITN
jgi:hypothetical protein